MIVTNDAITGPLRKVLENGDATDDITVVIPSDGQPRQFARLRIVIPTTPERDGIIFSVTGMPGPDRMLPNLFNHHGKLRRL